MRMVSSPIGARYMNSWAMLPPMMPTSAPGEDLEVCLVERTVLLVEPPLVPVETVCVLHGEFASPDQARPRSRIVPELGLYLIHEPGQPLVRVHLARGKAGDYLLVGHRQDHLPVPAVAESDQLLSRRTVTAGSLPYTGRLYDGHRQLLPTRRIHLLSQNLLDLVDRPLCQRQIRKDPRRQLSDVPCPE